MNRLATLAFVSVLAACTGLGPGQAQRYFVLEAAPSQIVAATTRRDAMLLVAPTTASAFYDTQEIIFSRSAGQRAYYQFSSWTEPPNRALAPLLAMRLEQGGAFRGVAETTSGVRGNLLLRTQLVEAYHDAASAPGSARVTIAAELSDPAGRRMLAHRTFTSSVPVRSHDAPGAVQGFNEAFGAILDDIASWVGGAAAIAN
ncbi:MAG: ABC-type transport auxiliary lipoprotein family protein [Caldimonas sp.]